MHATIDTCHGAVPGAWIYLIKTVLCYSNIVINLQLDSADIFPCTNAKIVYPLSYYQKMTIPLGGLVGAARVYKHCALSTKRSPRYSRD